MRFSVPSNCACNCWKFWFAFNSRIIFAHHQQPRERGAQLALRFLELLQLCRIRWRFVRIKLNPAHTGSCISHCFQCRFLEVGCARDRVHEIRNQIGAALIHVLHLRPLGVDVLLHADKAIVTACNRDRTNDENKER